MNKIITPVYQAFTEIFAQDESLQKTLDYILSQKEVLKDFFENSQYNAVVFLACGSSYWLSLSAAETFAEQTGVRATAVTSGDVLMNPDLYLRKFEKPLFICPSRSGNTTETLLALDILLQYYNDAQVLSITEYPDAPLHGRAHLGLQLPWAKEESVCQTRSFSNLYLAIVAMAAILGEDKNLIIRLQDYLHAFKKQSLKVNNFTDNLFESYPNLKCLVALGNGKLYGTACEGAYITVEMAQAPAHFFYTLEFRHGPIVLLDESYLVVLFSDGKQIELEQKLIAEMQAKGAKILVISAEAIFSTADWYLTLDQPSPAEVVGLYGSFVTQALAYHRALALDINPDQPKDLVQWIKI
jgi:fructoselysine-6-P-deglycase FrlB-like protein